MRLHRFYSPTPIEPQIVGSSTHYHASNQWRKVFRFKSGDRVILFDGSGFDFVCEISAYDDEGAMVKVLEINKNNVIAIHETFLCAAIVKKDTFEWIAQKATELGVSHIIPIVAERSEKKDVNVERLNKIIIEAAEQSGRATLPTLHGPIGLDEALGKFSNASIAWEPSAPLFYVDAKKSDNSKNQLSEKIIITYIGPEGGWSPAELSLFKEKGIATYSMGPQILRAETAVVAALSLIIFIPQPSLQFASQEI
jgi:16S rRNA (uracil1498-N3)-methyltransferase